MTTFSRGPVATRLQETQDQVDEVVGIMRVNVEKIIERDLQRQSELDEKAAYLDAHEDSGYDYAYEKSGPKRMSTCCKVVAALICLGLILLIILLAFGLIEIGIFDGTPGTNGNSSVVHTTTEAPPTTVTTTTLTTPLTFPVSTHQTLTIKDKNWMDAGKDVLALNPIKGDPIVEVE